MSASSTKMQAKRPSPLRTTKSFSVNSIASSPLENDSPKTYILPSPAAMEAEIVAEPDTFQSRLSEDGQDRPRASVDLEDLPIELVGLTDSFIDQLSAKVWPTPPNVDNLSQLFQEFYGRAEQHVQTHINTLRTRQRREDSPSPSTTRSSAASILRAKAASLGNRERPKTAFRRDSDQQMLTAEEYADRKRARKLLEQKKGLYEEAVERRLCEGIYAKIYRHRSTQDEAQDDKLRSKTAALGVVGIGPADLGVDLGLGDTPTPEAIAERQEEVKNWLEDARKELTLMNGSRYPLGKLNHLKAAHKCIIETLAHFHPSSSADELMPMLIFTLITTAPDKLNVISDVNFIQRFRWQPKLMGEAAYCLTNLEAAISFLETVDLSALRADEAPSGPVKGNSRPTSPRTDCTFPPAFQQPVPLSTEDEVAPKPASPGGIRVQLRGRRLSDLVNTPAQAIGAASDAMDQSLKTIGTSLGESYRFLLGRLREHPDGLPSGPSGDVMVPKTLDDARKLIGTPPPDDNDSVTSSNTPDDAERTPRMTTPLEDKVLNLIGGRKASRDHSVDSSRSRHRSVSSTRKPLPSAPGDERNASPASNSNPALIESVRNLGNTLNPMTRFSSFRGFGRSSPAQASVQKETRGADGGDLATAFPDIAAALPPKQAPKTKINPPIKRFIDLQSPADLKLGEVLELLRDYRRLAGALKDAGAFKDPEPVRRNAPF